LQSEGLTALLSELRILSVVIDRTGKVEWFNSYGKVWMPWLGQGLDFWEGLREHVIGRLQKWDDFVQMGSVRLQLMKNQSEAETFMFRVRPNGNQMLILGEHEIDDLLHLRQVFMDLQGELAQANRELQRKKLEAEDLNCKLKENNEVMKCTLTLKKAFLGNLRKDLLVPFRSYVQRLQQIMGMKTIHPELKDSLMDLLESSKGTQSRLDDLVLLSELEAGTLSRRVFSMPLGTTMETILSLVRRDADATGVKVTSDISKSCPVAILTDGRLFKEIILRLLRNAIRFSPGGQVMLLADLGNDKNLRIQICDNGIGLPEQIKIDPFESYYTEEGSVGKGIGLAIVFQMTRLLGGNLEASSEENRGTIFTLTLPDLETG